MKRKLSIFTAILAVCLSSFNHFSLFSANASSTVPVVVTTPATGLTMNSAVLNGTVNANNNTTTMFFEYGLTTAYGTIIAATPSTVTGNTITPVTAMPSGLAPCTIYHFHCCGYYGIEKASGSDMTFSTCFPPSVTTTVPTNITQTTATLNGIVSANNDLTSVEFILGTAGALDIAIPAVPSTVAGNTPTPVSATVTGLLPCTVYHYYCIGQNSSGSANGSDLTFTTGSDVPGPPGPITGPDHVCPCGTGYVYTVNIPNATGYIWTLPVAGAITSGINTNTITVSFACNAIPGYIFAYGTSPCGAGTPSQLYISMNPQEIPTITGMTDICVNSGYLTYTTQAGMTGYTWTLSPGGVISYGAGTNSIQVTWTSPGSQWVRVNYTNANGCSTSVPGELDVTVNSLPGPASTITGPDHVCAGSTGIAYSTTPITNATAFVWSLPAGAVMTAGAGTNSITVDFAPEALSGDIQVYGNNICGNGLVSIPFQVTVDPLPTPAGTITGPGNVSVLSSGVVYSIPEIPGATGYVWNLPPGTTIVSGANTNSISVDFTAAALSGAISVYGTNSCGDGPVSPDLTVNVNPIPDSPKITLNGYMLRSNYSAGNQWYRDGDLIAGATEQTYDASLNHTGFYWDIVSVNGYSSDTSNHVYLVLVGVNGPEQSSFSINPVPNDGRFAVDIVTSSQEIFTISVFNVQGVKIYEAQNIIVIGSLSKIIDIRPAADGIYSVVLVNGKNRFEKKIAINK